MLPSLLFLRWIFAWTFLGLAASIWVNQLGWVWLAATGVFVGVMVVDALTLPRRRDFSGERTLQGRFALGIPGKATMRLRHRLRREVIIEWIDGLPPTAEAPGLPWRGVVPPDHPLDLSYQVHFTARGLQVFEASQLLADSRLGLWRRHLHVGDASSTRCYPNYEPIVRYALLAMSNREEQMGIVKRRRTGATLDFHQLREYQDGDILSRVDWKASSRRQTLISRDYEEQRNQTLLLVPDCGRRMRSLDGELSQFDHCLNAMLLLSYIALKQGDEVGILSFGGDPRWLKPVKGPPAMPKILNHLYDYRTTEEPSDFAEAAERIMTLQKRRCLVIVLTNLRSEDSAHLLTAMHLLRQRHLVLLASLREAELDERAATPAHNLETVLGYGALCHYFHERDLLLRRLRSQRIVTLDETAQNLPVALANRYLDLKASGVL